jgi:hypothetical protein
MSPGRKPRRSPASTAGRRARAHPTPLGADHHVVAAQGGHVARRAQHHAHRGIDLGAPQIQAAVELAVELFEDRGGGVHGLRLTADRH